MWRTTVRAMWWRLTTLRDLAEHDPRKARIVELRFFGGLNLEEIGEVIGVAPITVSREWA